jgi:membrane-bound lytic murein transglycosylase D
MDMSRYRFSQPRGILLLLAPVLLLTGCPSGQQTPAPSPQATAPAIVSPPPPPAPPAPPPPTAQQLRVRQLIAQVEATYTRGETAYHRGQLAQAKTEFDRAIDLMLASGIDIKSEAQLQDEFDNVVDRVNALETEALKQGNGFVLPQEQTPSEAASDVTFAVDPNLVAKARAELSTTKSDLPLVVNDYVGAFINFFANTQKGHNTLLHSFQRSGRYQAMIQRVMAEEGVPQDLIYLAVAESGFQPRAINGRSRAGGMWQFMPSSDNYYGLARTEYVDERFDPEKSTRAYARYMKFLYDQLGDWYLAMAAYDWGAGNVQRAVQKTGYADFWELYRRHNLPAETQNYVPEILAAIIIANNRQQYGFDDVTLDPPVLTDTVTVDYSVDLRLVSDLVGAPVDELEALNPSLLRMITPPDQPFDLHLPAGTATIFDQRIAAVPENKRNSWRYHTVVAGDTIDSIAREYKVTTSELVSANQLTADQALTGVEALVVPVAFQAIPSTRARVYTVRKGDTLVTIADRFGVSLSQLRSWNGIASGVRVDPGRRLAIAEPAVQRSSSSSRRSTSSRKKAAATTKPAGPARTASSTSSRSSSKSTSTSASSKAHSSSTTSRTKSSAAASTSSKSTSSAHSAVTRKKTRSAN